MTKPFLIPLFSFSLGLASVVFASEPDDFLTADKPLRSSAEAVVDLASRRAHEDLYAMRQEGIGVSVMYGRGIPEIVCSPLRVCIIGLEEGEYITADGLHIGDPTRWRIVPTLGPNERTELVIKPVDAGLSTNLSVHTNKRTYLIDLTSRRRDSVPYLTFRYPVEPTQSAELTMDERWEQYYQRVNKVPATLPEPEPVAVVPQDYQFDYVTSPCRGRGCRAIMPERIFHDGQRTYIDLNPRYAGELPIFLPDARGRTTPTEARWHGKRLVVTGVVYEGRLELNRMSVGFYLKGK